jgi:hypothetical protein
MFEKIVAAQFDLDDKKFWRCGIGKIEQVAIWDSSDATLAAKLALATDKDAMRPKNMIGQLYERRLKCLF